MKLKDKQFKTVQVKGGKQYVEVKERLEYLSKEFEGEYSINTEYQFFETAKIWVVKATLTLVQDGKTNTYTGLGQEKEGGAGVNFTSALENAETSAVGRACAMAGIGIDISIASADEINKATNSQKQLTQQDQAVAQPTTIPQPESVPQATETIEIKYASNRQKEEITRLLQNPVITRQERSSMLLNINKFDETQADQKIAKIKATIKERENEQAIAS